MKFFTTFAIVAVATTSAVKLNEKASVPEQTLVQEAASASLTNDLKELEKLYDSANAQMESKAKSQNQAELQARMDNLERQMFDFNKAAQFGMGLARKYGHKYGLF